MPAPLKAGIPPDLDLDGGYTISFTALSPTTGALVAGVVVSAASLLVDNVGGGTLDSGFEDATPLWVPIPNNLFADEGT
jgi:hypothetical protein